MTTITRISIHIVLNLVLGLAAYAQCDGTIRIFSGNFSNDLYGPPDNRPGTWGHAEAVVNVITWKNVPVGCKVQVLRLSGDTVAWVEADVRRDLHVGYLVGYTTQGPEGSAHVDWGEDRCFLYKQGAIAGTDTQRLDISEIFANLHLGSDNSVRVVSAAWLNTTGYALHVENTYTFTFRYVDIDSNFPSSGGAIKIPARLLDGTGSRA